MDDAIHPRHRLRAGLLSAVVFAGAASHAADTPVVVRGAALFDRGVIPARVDVDMSRLPVPRRWRAGDAI